MDQPSENGFAQSNQSTNNETPAALPSVEQHRNDKRTKLSWRQWLEGHYDWSWFTCTQSTGGIAIVLSECPKKFAGLQTIGTIVFILNLVLWLTFTSLMILRWISKPSTFRRCFTAAPECYFYGSFWLSVATIIVCMQRFGVPSSGAWLLVAIRVCFWIYAAVTLLSTTIHCVVIFKHTPIKAIEMNPAWFIVVFQAMLTGTVAAAIAMDQPYPQRLPIIVAGVGYQGLGWLASLLTLAWFMGHLLQKGWPAPSQRPGLFMPIGTVGYTIVALIGNARATPKEYTYFASHPTANETLLIVARWAAVFMWVFGLWLFGLAMFVSLAEVVTIKDSKLQLPMSFNNTWWGKSPGKCFACPPVNAYYPVQLSHSPMLASRLQRFILGKSLRATLSNGCLLS